MPQTASLELPENIELTPDLWLIRLFRALRESDLATAAEAHERLSELGVDVTFTRLLPDGVPQ